MNHHPTNDTRTVSTRADDDADRGHGGDRRTAGCDRCEPAVRIAPPYDGRSVNLGATEPSSGVVARCRARVGAWVARHVVADEPHPELSRLDRWDNHGLDRHVRTRDQRRPTPGSARIVAG